MSPRTHWTLHAVSAGLVALLALALQRQRTDTETTRTQVTSLQTQLTESQATQTSQQTESEHETTTTTKPDGTKVVQVITVHEAAKQVAHEDIKATTVTKETQVTESTKSVQSASLARYSLELDWAPSQLAGQHYTPTAVSAGARLGSLPLWGVLSYLPGDHVATVGIRIEL